jgi:L-aminopeptidase/D-esterase-like protein
VTLTAVPGVRVGHWTDQDALTGVTVVVPPEPNVAAVEVRGAAPGTRETALLAPGMRVQSVQAIALCGGSAFGLAAADGIVAALEAEGRGHPTFAGPVPIVPAAVLFDLWIGDGSVRPTAADGAAALQAAGREPVEMGSVGAGTGATVAGWRGPAAVRKGGIGSASVGVDGATVGALVALNAVGDVFTLEGDPLTGGPPVPSGAPVGPAPLEQTTLVVLATDAALDREDLQRLCVRAHDALGVCLRPGHTRYDGDAVFAVSCGGGAGDPDALGEAAFAVVGRSIEAAIRTARSAGGVPAVEDS